MKLPACSSRTAIRHSRLLAVSVAILLGASVAVVAAVAPAADSDESQRLVTKLETLRALPISELTSQSRVVVRAMSAAEIALVRPLVLEAPASYGNDVLGALVMERWGEIDGPTAFTYAASLVSVHKIAYESRALVGWARQEPRAAWARLMLVSNRAADRRYDESDLLLTIAEIDLPLALELFQDLMADRSCLLCNAETLVICALRHHQLPLITAEIAKLPAGPTRDGLRDAYWSVVGHYATADALATVGKISGRDDAHAARVHLVQGWAGRDFAAAFDYVLKHFDAQTIDDAILPMIQVWSRGAVAEDVSAVIKNLPENLSERSVLGVVPILARVDPAAATDWAVSFTNPAIRRECLFKAMWEWAHIDGEAAQTYLRAKTDLEVRGYLLRSFLFSRVGNNTLQLADLDDLSGGFNNGWVVGVLEELTLRLADPSTNRSASFNLPGYRTWVNTREFLNADQRTQILRALDSSAKK